MFNSYKTIKINKKQKQAWITLDRPDKLNSINLVMLQELSEVIENLEADPKIRCIVITGKGDKAFSAGADLNELQKLTPKTVADFSVKGQQHFSKIEKLSKPVIAAINGYALGGGLELALACDFRIASNDSMFGFPEITMGFLPAWGGTQRLPLLVGVEKAKQLILLGNIVNVKNALTIGLVDKVIPATDLKNEVEKFAQKICEISPTAFKHAQKTITSVTFASFDLGLKKETESFVELFSLVETQKNLVDFVSRRNKK